MSLWNYLQPKVEVKLQMPQEKARDYIVTLNEMEVLWHLQQPMPITIWKKCKRVAGIILTLNSEG